MSSHEKRRLQDIKYTTCDPAVRTVAAAVSSLVRNSADLCGFIRIIVVRYKQVTE